MPWTYSKLFSVPLYVGSTQLMSEVLQDLIKEI